VNLLPYLLRISQRPEEMIQETLVAALTKICPVLGGFMNDIETKVRECHVLYCGLLWIAPVLCCM